MNLYEVYYVGKDHEGKLFSETHKYISTSTHELIEYIKTKEPLWYPEIVNINLIEPIIKIAITKKG